VSISLVGVGTATALVLDLVAELRARRALPDLVPVWPEHRPYAVAAAREALAAAGIPVHVRAENVRRMLQFGGPFAPMDLLVRRADAERAAEILGAVLRYRAEDQPVDREPDRAPPRRFSRAEASLLGAAAALAVATLLLPGSPAAPPPRSHAPARPEALQLLEVDDEANYFGGRFELPPGFSFRAENVPAGPGRSLTRSFAQVTPTEGESLAQARARLLAWAEPIVAPDGLRVLAGPVTEYDAEIERSTQIGWRTWLVKRAPIADGADVKSAHAVPQDVEKAYRGGWAVVIELAPAGAERFRAFTVSHLKRRLAMVVDGVVESAPVIQAEIPGGHIQITMGTGDPEKQREDAKRLEDRLLGR
jgi:hypothetical protein